MGRSLGEFAARQKIPFVSGQATTWDKKAFGPGSWLDPGQKVFFGRPQIPPAYGPPLLLGGSITRDKRGPVFIVPAKPSSLSFASFYFSFKIGYHLLIELKKLWFQKLSNNISDFI